MRTNQRTALLFMLRWIQSFLEGKKRMDRSNKIWGKKTTKKETKVERTRWHLLSTGTQHNKLSPHRSSSSHLFSAVHCLPPHRLFKSAPTYVLHPAPTQAHNRPPYSHLRPLLITHPGATKAGDFIPMRLPHTSAPRYEILSLDKKTGGSAYLHLEGAQQRKQILGEIIPPAWREA